MNWKDLSMSQRADLMNIYLKNGITSLDEMRQHYNSFAEGGNIPPKEDPAYKSLSERIMYRFWKGKSANSVYDLPKLEGESDIEYRNRINGRLGGTPQRTYLLDRKRQRDSMLYNGYIEGTPGDYELVEKAVGNRDIPVYQTQPDDISRDYLVPIANINNTWYGSEDAKLRHAGSYPTALYVDGRTGNTFYQKAWDLNDYGPKYGGNKIKRSNLFARARATLADMIGSPIVQTTGFQQVSDTNIDEAYDKFLGEHGLHLEDGLISLPVVSITADKEYK